MLDPVVHLFSLQLKGALLKIVERDAQPPGDRPLGNCPQSMLIITYLILSKEMKEMSEPSVNRSKQPWFIALKRFDTSPIVTKLLIVGLHIF